MKYEYLNTILLHGLNKSALKNRTGIDLQVMNPRILSSEILPSFNPEINDISQAEQNEHEKTKDEIHNKKNQLTSEAVYHSNKLMEPEHSSTVSENIDEYSFSDSNNERQKLQHQEDAKKEFPKSIKKIMSNAESENTLNISGELSDKDVFQKQTKTITGIKEERLDIKKGLSVADVIQNQAKIKTMDITIPFVRQKANPEFFAETTPENNSFSEGNLSSISENMNSLKQVNELEPETGFVLSPINYKKDKDSDKNSIVPQLQEFSSSTSGTYSKLNTELKNELNKKQEEIKNLREKLKFLEIKMNHHIIKEERTRTGFLPKPPISRDLGGWTTKERSYFK